MSTLPPEILSRVFELAVPDGTFLNFSERSNNLRSFALVCSAWRVEAQRALLNEPVLYSKHEKSYTSLITTFEREKSKYSARNLRVEGANSLETLTDIAQKSMQSCLSSTLRMLSVASLALDVEILSILPNLQNLSLYDVSFSVSTPGVATPSLPKLTDLSLSYLKECLPTCLSARNLPALQRLAYIGSACGCDGDCEQYSLKDISDLRQQLDFFGCGMIDPIVRKQDVEPIADYTLFDFDHFSHPAIDATPIPLCIKHARIQSSDLKNDSNFVLSTTFGMVFIDYWTPEHLQDLVERLPNLETLILPACWSDSPLYQEFLELVTDRTFTILHDEYSTRAMEETHISGAFKEHRRKLRENGEAN